MHFPLMCLTVKERLSSVNAIESNRSEGQWLCENLDFKSAKGRCKKVSCFWKWLDSAFLFQGAHCVCVLFFFGRELQLWILVYFANSAHKQQFLLLGELLRTFYVFMFWSEGILSLKYFFFKVITWTISMFHSTNTYWAYLYVRHPSRYWEYCMYESHSSCLLVFLWEAPFMEAVRK